MSCDTRSRRIGGISQLWLTLLQVQYYLEHLAMGKNNLSNMASNHYLKTRVPYHETVQYSDLALRLKAALLASISTFFRAVAFIRPSK